MDPNQIKQYITLWMKSLATVDNCSLTDSSMGIKCRDLSMTGIPNARQLGGYTMADGRKIKPNLLLRTANLHNATEEDCRRLAEEYKLRLVIDLRSRNEHDTMPDRPIAGAEEIWVNLMEKSMGKLMDAMAHSSDFVQSVMRDPDPAMLTVYMSQVPAFQQNMNNLYLDMVESELALEGFRQIFQKLLELEGQTVLWHCAQGKDRCGLTAALILGALGAEEKLILDDFEISNVYYKNVLDYNFSLLDRGVALEAESRQSLQTKLEENPETTSKQNLQTKLEENPEITSKHSAQIELIRHSEKFQATHSAIQGIVGVNRFAMQKALTHIGQNYGTVKDFVQERLGVSDREIEQLRLWYLE